MAPSMSSGICCPKVGFKIHNDGLIPWDDKTPWILSELNFNDGVFNNEEDGVMNKY
jgi:hypothetical protein